MKWEKCKRCGSNRVVKKSSGGIGILLFIVGCFFIDMSGKYGSEIPILVIVGLILAAIGILLFFFTGRLYCKDCEIQWVPIKSKTN